MRRDDRSCPPLGAGCNTLELERNKPERRNLEGLRNGARGTSVSGGDVSDRFRISLNKLSNSDATSSMISSLKSRERVVHELAVLVPVSLFVATCSNKLSDVTLNIA